MKSSPAGRACWCRRNASRNSRFQRFRTTALPTFRDTDNPTRGCGRPFAAAYTTSSPSDTDRFLSYTALNSVGVFSRWVCGNVNAVMESPSPS